jgi:hypothetical protein
MRKTSAVPGGSAGTRSSKRAGGNTTHGKDATRLGPRRIGREQEPGKREIQVDEAEHAEAGEALKLRRNRKRKEGRS